MLCCGYKISVLYCISVNTLLGPKVREKKIFTFFTKMLRNMHVDFDDMRSCMMIEIHTIRQFSPFVNLNSASF